MLKGRWTRVVLSAASLALTVVLVFLLPHFIGTDWHRIVAEFGKLSFGAIALMTALWFGSLVAYTWVLTRTLPGLSHPRALVLCRLGSDHHRPGKRSFRYLTSPRSRALINTPASACDRSVPGQPVASRTRRPAA